MRREEKRKEKKRKEKGERDGRGGKAGGVTPDDRTSGVNSQTGPRPGELDRLPPKQVILGDAGGPGADREANVGRETNVEREANDGGS
jgi:hypothetical protein